MKRFRISVVTVFVFICGWITFGWMSGLVYGGETPAASWSNTNPPINETHIFSGQVKTDNSGNFIKVVGFHSTAAPATPVVGVVLAVQDKPNGVGVYTATVQITAGGKKGTKFSSMYPSSMSKDDVLQAVLYAYNNKTSFSGTKFSGPSGKGFDIEGYLTPDYKNINTAYPIYVK